jgi:hypothetical protein
MMPWQRPRRFWRHLATDHRSVRRAFPEAALARIEAAVAAGEHRHRGQVVFAIEAALPLHHVLGKLSPRERAIEVFSQLRVWDTEENCGVLIYLLLADKDVEIVADRGVHGRAYSAAWEAICRTMESALSDGRPVDAALAGIEAAHALLAQHYPADGARARNEIPDRPVVL